MPGRGRKRTRESEGTPKTAAKRQKPTKENTTVAGKKKGKVTLSVIYKVLVKKKIRKIKMTQLMIEVISSSTHIFRLDWVSNFKLLFT